MKLILRRAGTFKANWKSGDNVCGHGKPGPQTYNYSCEIVSDESRIDKNGFIVDQLDVDKVFQEMFFEPSDPDSCERMAIRFVYHIRQMVLDHLGSYSVHRVTVAIGPVPPKGVKGEASITAEWVA